uniref:Cadherin 15 n=1 Tax=Panthera tigris altaica TaxID=74533 RepID=A0A8C9K833_PANTA
VPGQRRPSTLYPWHRAPAPGRVRRAWVIPPISVSENHNCWGRSQAGLLSWQIKSDKQPLGSVIYSIQGPGVDEEPQGVFSIDKFTGKVFLNAMLDREKTDRFRLRAFALDLGGATLEEPTDLEIVVVDQNDNRPVFRQEAFSGRVLEGAVPGTYVTRAEATDADDPETDNAALRYSILEQDGPQLFSIDEHTGDIRTVQVGLDREVVAVYNLTLQVADMSGDGLTATASAIITLEDVNDNAPGFTRDEATEAVSGVDVGRLQVEDRDLPGSPNWAARFTILEGDPKGQFAIRTDPKTNEGVLSVVKPLDYESCEQYNLRVAVQNEAPLQAAAPKVGAAGVRQRGRCVQAGPSCGHSVPSSANSYSKDYDPDDWLRVDRATGQIQTQRVLSPASPFLKDGWYRAIILAYDDASPPSTATGTLSIEILEVNDHAPELSPPSGSVCSKPDQGSGLLLGATDADLPPHGAPFHFQLSPRVPELTRNWSVSQVNGEFFQTRVRGCSPETWGALNTVVLLVSGSSPTRPLLPAARGAEGPWRGRGRARQVGRPVLTLGALCSEPRAPSGNKRFLHGLQDDLRDNILNYDEQGGGEEDQDAYDINQLRHPTELAALCSPLGRPPLRRDAPFGRVRPQPPRMLPTSPADIADFINDGLEVADSDPSVPPYDTALIYDYEGDGSVAGTLSSILSSLGDEDQDYSCLRDWGPRFARLADLYGPP